MWSELYEAIAYHGGIQAITFLGNRPSFTEFMALCNFNMEVNVKILRCGISRKRMIVEPNGRKFGTRGTRVNICRVLFLPLA